jgi:hypothetical protein
MLRLTGFAAAFLSCAAVQDVPTVAEADADGEADETCALQLQKTRGSVNCGGNFANSCEECPQGHGAAWCNGQCTWDYSSNTCGPVACCKAYTADCLACSTGVTTEVYCNANQGKNIPGCPSPTPSPTPAPSPQSICALCESCGGNYPLSGGRVTYFRDQQTEFSSYGEECSGQERSRQPDGSVIFSPQICCSPAFSTYPSLLQTEQKKATVEVQERVLSEQESRSNASGVSQGFCLLCDQCGGGFDYEGGSITELSSPPNSADSNSQNYESHGGYCSSYVSTKGAPPAAKVCCQKSPSLDTGACKVCQGSCGGAYPSDGGALSYTTNGLSVKFTGLGSGCHSDMYSRVSHGASDAPRLCCGR